jgi:catechol 2,3-dioxygenase-like lactoylglutathione lyase family enzyme
MKASVQFYRDVLGMELLYGGERACFSSLRAKDSESAILNLEQGDRVSQWGRLILHVTDVDAFWTHLREKGFDPGMPRDASWGERYFHMLDPGWPRVVVCAAATMSWPKECVQTRCVWRLRPISGATRRIRAGRAAAGAKQGLIRFLREHL